MSNVTERLFSAVSEYRAAMENIFNEYDDAMKTAGRRKDSSDSVKTNLKEKVDACKAEYAPQLQSVVKEVKDQVACVSLRSPTEDQLRLLTVMAMQPILFEGILIQAVQKLSSSPLAVEALRGIAAEKKARWPVAEVSGTFCTLTGARTICDALNERITNLLTCDEQSVICNKDFANADECFQALAGINEAQSKAFFELLGRKELSEITY